MVGDGLPRQRWQVRQALRDLVPRQPSILRDQPRDLEGTGTLHDAEAARVAEVRPGLVVAPMTTRSSARENARPFEAVQVVGERSVSARLSPEDGCDPAPKVRLMPSTPHSQNLSRFRPVFSAPNVPKFRAKKPITRCLDRRTEWSIWNPSGSDRRDPNSLAPNRIEARTTPLRPSRTSTSS